MIFAHDTEVALAAAAALVNTSPEADRPDGSGVERLPDVASPAELFETEQPARRASVHAERFGDLVGHGLDAHAEPAAARLAELGAAARPPAAPRSTGTAKPMPIEPPVGEMIAVLMPITSPSMLNSGPPELPG